MYVSNIENVPNLRPLIIFYGEQKRPSCSVKSGQFPMMFSSRKIAKASNQMFFSLLECGCSLTREPLRFWIWHFLTMPLCVSSS